MMWVIFAAMAVVAAAFVVVPLVKAPRALSGSLFAATIALAAGVYWLVGSPGTPSGAGQLPDIGQMVAGLAERLEERPDDVEGWKMLGRSYMQLGNYPGAVEAFGKAVELEGSQQAQTLIELGEAHLSNNDQQITAREIALFENAVRIDPESPSALFWGGIAAANRGDNGLAATRWSKLRTTEPPPTPEVMRVLDERIAAWRGEPVHPPVGAAAAPETPTAETAAEGGASIRLTVALSDAARNALPANASVYVIARDPAQPSPPIAVQRRTLSELPAELTLSDRDAMIPGRTLSAFDEVEIVARASSTGQPVQQPGDWFTMASVATSNGEELAMVIDEQVR